MATQAIGKAAVLEVFDAEFGTVTAACVPGVEILGWIIPCGDHEAEVEALVQRFRLVDDPPLVLPATEISRDGPRIVALMDGCLGLKPVTCTVSGIASVALW